MVIFGFKTKITWFLSDDIYLKMVYRIFLDHKLDINNPKTYNEKLQWLKINDRKSFYTKCADKYEARSFVENVVGKEYLVPLIGVYENIDDIKFEELPNEFVLKTTHDSGGVVVCFDKTNIDINKVKRKIKWSLNRKYFYLWREWPYKNIKPKIICEKKLGSKGSVPIDYKVLCFNGKAEFIEVHTDRMNEHKQAIYDVKGNLTNINNIGYTSSGFDKTMKISFLDEMLELANKIAEYFIHIRVDFFYCDDKLYVGELTFYDGAGFVPWENDGDEKLGNYLKLDI